MGDKRGAGKARSRKTRYLFWKRILDIVFSFLLLFFLAIPMLVICLCVSLSSRGGAIFRQTRVGRGGRKFICYKFRTMYRDAPPNVPTSVFEGASLYITPVGRFLRRTSLDELPQLINVLKGDMSLIGPRPLIGEETEMHRMRMESGVYSLRPGITGLAQVSGRDSLADEQKAALDARYAENVCFLSDLRILGRTLGRVIGGDGVAR